MNKKLAKNHFNVNSEIELRNKFYCSKSDLSINEKNILIKYINKFTSPNYLEIGVYFGGTFSKILDFLNKNKHNYTAIGIDLFEDIFNDKSNNTHHFKNKYDILNVAIKHELESKLKGNFKFYKGFSDVVVNENKFEADVYFIDGNHTYDQTKKDAIACLKYAKIGSYIIFHNASKNIPPDNQYYKKDGGPYQACSDIISEYNVKLIEENERIRVIRV